MAKNKAKKGCSCLGALLIFFLLITAVTTGAVQLLFRGDSVPKILSYSCCYYRYDDMGDEIGKGSFIIAEDAERINRYDTVLYRNEKNEYHIADVSLIVEADSNVPGQTASSYYLTSRVDSQSNLCEQDAIIGVCKRKSPELGRIVGTLLSMPGIVVGLILPILIMFIYFIASASRKKDDEDSNFVDEDDVDLAFVKSIQKKQQKIAERDAKRKSMEKDKKKTFDDAMYEDEPEKAKQKQLTPEEREQQEAQEAQQRAERIASIRANMESRRKTETPDGVPLYTTEIITKTHTLSIPKIGDEEEKKPEPELKPTPSEQIPRLTSTGHLHIPTPEQIEAEKREQEHMAKAQAIAKAAQEQAFGDFEKPKTPEKAEEPEEPIQEEPQQEKVKEAAPAPKKKQRIASAKYEDLIAFLDKEQGK